MIFNHLVILGQRFLEFAVSFGLLSVLVGRKRTHTTVRKEEGT